MPHYRDGKPVTVEEIERQLTDPEWEVKSPGSGIPEWEEYEVYENDEGKVVIDFKLTWEYSHVSYGVLLHSNYDYEIIREEDGGKVIIHERDVNIIRHR